MVEELTVAWALEAPGDDPRVRVLADDNSFVLPLRRLGGSSLFAGAATLPPGTAFRWNYEITDGIARRRTLLPDIPAVWDERPSGRSDLLRRIRGSGRPLEVYATPPDARSGPGVPRGELIEHLGWRSRVFPGTTRDWWVYVPAQYRPEEPACVMVFQDGAGPKDYVPVVFDNLIARGDMPVTVGVFIMPGVLDDGERNRSFEYDTLSDQYARFLLDEILPEVEQTVRLRHDAASRAISGSSSGGICSFTVAWERPDAFHKVLSWVGSFTDIRGGHNYPSMIRKTPPKPIRVFLQDGENDLNVPAGDWWLANQEMASALAFAGYDFTVAWGKGFHSARHGRAILPDSLRWLWRDWRG
jgi:enterochelin esterase family protein